MAVEYEDGGVVGPFGTVSKSWRKRLEEMEIRGRIKNIHIIALLRLARILRKVLETRSELLSITPQ